MQPEALAVSKSAAGRTDLATGLAWNLVSLAFLALAGILLNIAIGRWYSPAALGTFNVVFAIYIFLSQLAAFGLQFSALQAVSTAGVDDAVKLRRIIQGGLLACLAIASLVTLCAFLGTPLLARLFPAVPDFAAAWVLAAPGLIPFALNKLLLGVVNGLQHMRAFAVLQAGRYVFILASLGILTALGAPGYSLAGVLAVGEFILLCALASYVARIVPMRGEWREALHESRRHLRFGIRILPAGMVGELNTRVDVLMLGALLNDRAAGVYSIAALIFEAALQAVVVVRNNISPQLARSMAASDRAGILKFSRKLGLGVTLVMAFGALGAYLLYPHVAGLLFGDQDFAAAHQPLFWLMLALPFAAAPLCYSLILSQANRPALQSLAMTLSLAVNFLGNALLIPRFGMEGAAFAMGLSAIAMGIMIVVISRLALRVRLFI
ncbi:Membrane protein involved in the export of O-antigen and teichoic acid OS=Bosea thiooxidans OX=53254 GN=SAMN05660750_04429 PE=4 SV=1 [Bosea thiooxidans]|uniref:Membrane protein involved in the export of O-antigen and teichoic acid n=1 Tax=Bosea thiooxidans TaxID=53254 RepID=A0A1T5GV50_9HYPH|nr:oligosaccharide flippase family protein [Bosea thiooxidans]SKC12249.1 Membrane protein involved in the export of O-antigen and teichoic acid [Bosea thiooxidans]